MRYDAVVIGAGLPGLLAAWKLAEGGFRVAVLERGTIASESSALAAGHIPQESTSSANLAVLLRTRAIIDELDRVTGGMVRFHVVAGCRWPPARTGQEPCEPGWIWRSGSGWPASISSLT